MESGIIGFVHGDFGRIKDETTATEDGDTELLRRVEVDETQTLESGREIQTGSVAKDKKVKQQNTQITDEGIVRRETTEIDTDYAPFAAIPGEVIILGTGAGTFGFDLIGRQVEALVERAEINLGDFVGDYEDGSFWQYGFYNSGLNAEKGVLYGVEVDEDNTAQTFMNSATPNQIGLDILYGDKPVKLTMSESGYVEVYQPGDWETPEYVDFVADVVLPYVRSP